MPHSSAVVKFIALKCHHVLKQNFIFVIALALKWMATMMVFPARNSGVVIDCKYGKHAK